MTVRNPSAAIASDGRMSDLANAVLQKGGSAADACIAAWFAAAAVFPAALLGPVHMIVAGPGVGLHSYDGSVVQPGRSVPRPRGYQKHEAVPDAARIGAPSSVAAIAAAHAQDGRMSLSESATAAARMAQSEDASLRSALIRRIASVGPLAMREPAFSRPLLDVAGRSQGGNLTIEDLEQAAAGVGRPIEHLGLLLLPRETQSSAPVELQSLIACVCDGGGVLGVIHIGIDPSAIVIDQLQVAAPRLAVPVMRGVPRITPGKPVPAPAPIAISVDSGLPQAAIGFESSRDLIEALSEQQHRTGLEFDQWLRNQAGALAARSVLAMVRPSSSSAAPRQVQFVL